jgi:predicted 2-oxoglutarate/Fe(II)-dependent dioxygenase YbiX
VRVATFFCLPGMVRDDNERAMLFEPDSDVQRLAAGKGTNDSP